MSVRSLWSALVGGGWLRGGAPGVENGAPLDGGETEALDPYVARALRLLSTSQTLPGEDGAAGGARHAGAQASASEEALTQELLREQHGNGAWLDVGVWGHTVMHRAAKAATRMYRVALSGDE